MNQSDDRRNRRHRQLAPLLKRADAIGARRDPEIDKRLRMLEQGYDDSGLAELVAYMLDDFEEEQRYNPNYLEGAPDAVEDLYGQGKQPDYQLGVTTETGIPVGLLFRASVAASWSRGYQEAARRRCC